MRGVYRFHLWVGVIILFWVVYGILEFQSNKHNAAQALDIELKDNPFRGLADAAIETQQLEWGWAVLLLAGCAWVIAAAYQNRPQKPTDQNIDPGIRRRLIAETVLLAALVLYPFLALHLSHSRTSDYLRLQTEIQRKQAVAEELCKAERALSLALMRGRQAGVPKNRALPTNRELRTDIVEKLLEAAYRKPRYSDIVDQKLAILNFSNKAYTDCVTRGLPPD